MKTQCFDVYVPDREQHETDFWGNPISYQVVVRIDTTISLDKKVDEPKLEAIPGVVWAVVDTRYAARVAIGAMFDRDTVAVRCRKMIEALPRLRHRRRKNGKSTAK